MKKRLLVCLLTLLLLPLLACNFPLQSLLDFIGTAAAPTQTPFPPTPTPIDKPITLVENVEYEENDRDQFRIEAIFPYLPNTIEQADGFNRAMAEFATAALNQFRADAAQAAPFDAPTTESYLNTTYDVMYNDRGVLSLRVWINYYIKGAAHPGTYARTFNYDLHTGELLALEDLFLPQTAFLDSLATVCQAEIISRDAGFWPDGAAPEAGNYANWNVRADGLLITFDEYQVAPYAAGPQEVMVPYPQFDGLLDAASIVSRIRQ